MNQDRALHDIFLEEGHVSKPQLEDVLANREDITESVADILLRKGLVTPAQKVAALAVLTGVPAIDLAETEIAPASARKLSQRSASRHKAILVEASTTAATVAMANALDLEAIDEIAAEIGLDVDPVWAVESDINEKIVAVYGAFNDLENILVSASQDDDLEFVSAEPEDNAQTLSLAEISEGSPVVQFVNGLFLRAIRMRASDLHIQPRSKSVSIQFRVDGVLRDIMQIPRDVHRAIASRVKVISGLDIAERRIPQDGRCSLLAPEGEFDFRVATYPSVHGEKITIRVLDKSNGLTPINQLGIEPLALARLRWAVDQSQGLILVTGPTGAGKTTTLYSLLTHLNNGDRNIVTVEDPVEYQIDGIVQGHVNNAAGMTFAAGLRAILRADPDVILVGESRDPETAKTSIEAALTGHLVLTSLHANDSAAAITRLVEMGVEEFLVSASVTCSVSQRLLRANCPHCSRPYQPDPELLARLGLPEKGDYQKGLGCEACSKLGFKGRIGVYEILAVTPAVQRLILEGTPAAQIREFAAANGMDTLLEDAAKKAAAGLTTVEELARVVASDDKTEPLNQTQSPRDFLRTDLEAA